MRPLTLTAAVVRHFMQAPTMPGTVLEWLRTEADPEQRALLFAVNLSEDCIAEFKVPESPDKPEAALHNALTRMAIDRVCWQRVAKVLLRHFTLPMILASPAPVKDWQSKNRMPPAPVEWLGPVN